MIVSKQLVQPLSWKTRTLLALSALVVAPLSLVGCPAASREQTEREVARQEERIASRELDEESEEGHVPETSIENLARMVAAYELQGIHARDFERRPGSEPDLVREWLDKVLAAFMPETLDYSWLVRYIPRAPDIAFFEGREPDKLESAAIAAMERSKDEHWQRSSNGTWRFVTALPTAGGSCQHCHVPGEKNAATRAINEPLSYVSVRLLKKSKPK